MKPDTTDKITKEQRERITGHVKCHKCGASVPLTDWCDAERRFAEHLHNKHKEPFPSWY